MNEAPGISEQLIKRIQKHIDRMPSLSTTVTKVLEICNRPDTSPNDLNRVISLDPVLTGQVLKLINSAYYSLPNQVSSLARAIIMLGLNTVKNLALSTAILGTVGREEAFQSLAMDAFWTHSLCVGVTAKQLAIRARVPRDQQEEYFVAGLLHDLGKIPLNNCFAQEYRQAQELAILEEKPLCRAETTLMGIDHGQVGRMIGEKWQLSENLVALLAHHHEPEAAPAESRGLVQIALLANAYANVNQIGSAGDRHPDRRQADAVAAELGIAWGELAELDETVRQEIDKAQVFLKVAKEVR
ncbi:MAG: HDOD domain-containing protein [Thermodesulfobacteriota bacterium]|jgi:HD-like signal output (HDOD) protein